MRISAGRYRFEILNARNVCDERGEPFGERFAPLVPASGDPTLFERLLADEPMEPIWVAPAGELGLYQPNQGSWKVIGGNTAIIAVMRAMVDTVIPGGDAPYRIAWCGTVKHLAWLRANGYVSYRDNYRGEDAENALYNRLAVANFRIPFLIKDR